MLNGLQKKYNLVGGFFILFASVRLHKFLQLEVGEWGGLVNGGKCGHFSGDMGVIMADGQQLQCLRQIL